MYLWPAAREVMGDWPAAHGEPDWWEDILSDYYQSIQPMWLCLQQGAPTEDPQRWAAAPVSKSWYSSQAFHCPWKQTQHLDNTETIWFLFSQWPPDTVSPFWLMRSTVIWWVKIHTSTSRISVQVARCAWPCITPARHILQHIASRGCVSFGGICPGSGWRGHNPTSAQEGLEPMCCEWGLGAASSKVVQF